MAPAPGSGPPADPFPPLPPPSAPLLSVQPATQIQSQPSAPPLTSYAAAARPNQPDLPLPAPIPVSSFKGESAVDFPPASIAYGKASLQYTLVGKFANRRPTVDRIRAMLTRMQLKSGFVVGSFDYQHVMIKLSHMEDYQRLFARENLFVGNYKMRTFKWTPEFKKDRESSIVPVWVLFPELPLNYFSPPLLCNIAAVVGRPLKLDTATTTFTRPSVARICVEVDLLKPQPRRVWIGSGVKDEGFWQTHRI